ncbi:MAG: phosphoenolpyruvate synthase regulatory protein, partial [Hyphomicrobium sp.]
MANSQPSYFHLHLVSDSTGETLTTIAKAAAVQYAQIRP